ncbi:MAG: lysylphosphatidylglycerol synthase transmembrane domain-containing protein [Pirellulales bacterium]
MSDHQKRQKRWLRLAIHLAVLVLITWGVGRTILDAIDELREYSVRLSPSWLITAGGLYLLGLLPMGLFWHRTLIAMGQRPGVPETLRAFYIGHIGKYVPGKVMVVVLRTGMLRSQRVQTSLAAATVFLETLTMMAVGAFLAAVMLCFWLRNYLQEHDYLLPLAIGLLLLAGLPTLPPVFRLLVQRLGVARGDPQLESKLRAINFRLMALGWVAVAVGWLLLASSLWAVMRAMDIDGLQGVAHLPFYVAAVTLAVVAGFLSLIPGGVLVREMILTAVLGEIYFGMVLGIPLADGTALAVAVVLRLIWLAAEVLLALLLYFLKGQRPDG